MTKANYRKTAVLSGTLLATVSCATAAEEAKAVKATKPNIIYILADDLGYRDLACFGQTKINTPNIDKMRAEGMKFTQHYAGSTVCGPSRSCLLAGRHTGHTYVRGNGKIAVRPDPQDIVIPRLLKGAGYNTAMIGKSGLACNNQDGDLANNKGFDHFFGLTSHTDAHFYFPPHLWKNGKQVKYPNNKQTSGDTFSSTEITKDALQYIERQKDGPFFMHLAYQEPHAGLRAPEEFKKMYRGKFDEKPSKNRHYGDCKEPKTTYAAMVTHLDHNVGLVFKKLKELGLDDNTLVIFASDNGSMNEGGYQREWFKSSGELRGGKRDLYDGGIRTPMIARWPGKVPANSTSDHISAFWDFMPTACELAGVSTPESSDGISMTPTLLGKNDQQKKHKYLYWEFHEGGGKQAIRMGNWKAVRLKTGSVKNPPVELYNLVDDIGESKDLAASYPEIVAEMKKLMEEAHTPSELFKLASEKTSSEKDSRKKKAKKSKKKKH